MASKNEASSRIEQIPAMTTDELLELKRAGELPIVFDEECPETPPERALRFKRVNPPRKTTSSPA